MKTNFKISKEDETKNDNKQVTEVDIKKDLTNEEFEKFIIKAGAAGSFMVFRSDKNEDDELGLDEL